MKKPPSRNHLVIPFFQSGQADPCIENPGYMRNRRKENTEGALLALSVSLVCSVDCIPPLFFVALARPELAQIKNLSGFHLTGTYKSDRTLICSNRV